jgi:hypothetical protein
VALVVELSSAGLWLIPLQAHRSLRQKYDTGQNIAL